MLHNQRNERLPPLFQTRLLSCSFSTSSVSFWHLPCYPGHHHQSAGSLASRGASLPVSEISVYFLRHLKVMSGKQSPRGATPGRRDLRGRPSCSSAHQGAAARHARELQLGVPRSRSSAHQGAAARRARELQLGVRQPCLRSVQEMPPPTKQRCHAAE